MRRFPRVTAIVLAAACALSGAQLLAQDAPPGTDVYLATIASDGEAGLTDLRNVTDRDGYDNQPSFSADGGTVFYTSIRSGEDGVGQADIYANDLSSAETRQVTDTATSEYSPTQIPGEQAISVVRVESDGETQRLWRFPLGQDGTAGEPSLILEKIQPVGYHAWLVNGARKELVLFVLDEPHRLVRTQAEPQADGRTAASDIGRALHRIPGEEAFSFVHKAGDDWTVTRLDASAAASDQLTPLFPTFPEREDLTWSSDGWAWMGDGGKLYRRKISDENWTLFADLTDQLPGEITRLAASPDSRTLALVSTR